MARNSLSVLSQVRKEKKRMEELVEKLGFLFIELDGSRDGSLHLAELLEAPERIRDMLGEVAEDRVKGTPLGSTVCLLYVLLPESRLALRDMQ